MRKSGLFGRKGVTPGPNTQLSLHVEGANGQPTQAELDEEAEEVRHTPAALHPCRASARTPSQHARPASTRAQRARRRAWWRAGDERDDGRHHGAPQARGARRHTTHTGVGLWLGLGLGLG